MTDDAMHPPIKVGFVLLSPSRAPIPSTRIAVLNMFPLLREAGFAPHIVFEPEQGSQTPNVDGLLPELVAQRYDVIVFQKVHGASVEALAHGLREAGIKTVFALCDVVDVPMAQATDMTVIVTDYLKSLYPAALQHKIRVVHDGIEHPEVIKQDWGSHRGSAAAPLRAVLVTSAEMLRLPVLPALPPWLEVTIVGRYAASPLARLRSARWTYQQLPRHQRLPLLRFLFNRRIRCVPWHPERVYDAMREADIGIIPIERMPVHAPGTPAPDWKVKSENRLTMKMAIGLPVIATPIPSYEPAVQQGVNAYLAETPADWLACLKSLRDPAARAAMGQAARESALRRYSMQEQARLLSTALKELVGK